MAIWGGRRGAVGGASADRIDPEVDTDETPSTNQGDRGIPPVNQRSYQSRGQLLAIAAAIGVLLLLMWLVNVPDKPIVAANDPMATKNQRFDEGRPSSRELAPLQAQPFEPPKPPMPVLEPIQVVPKIDPRAAPQGVGAQAVNRPLTPLEKRMRSKTVIFEEKALLNAAAASTAGAPAAQPIPGLPGLFTDGSVRPMAPVVAAQRFPALNMPIAAGGPGSAPPSDASLAAGEEGGVPPNAGGPSNQTRPVSADEGGVGQLLRPTRLEGAAAARFPDRTSMMARGKLIDCVLDTAISTVVAGMTKCSLTRDVHGEDGRMVLLDRGTELTGEYRSNLRPGQTRLGIVWARAKTPAGIVIELASPATDSLGRSGVDGYVETHFWERYGAAILLSSLDDALAIVANRSRSNGAIYVPPNISRTGRDAAAVALENNIRIPPTIIKNQGEHIAVFVARDLDFRSVYGYRGTAGLSN